MTSILILLQDYGEDMDSGVYRCIVTNDVGRKKIGKTKHLNVTSIHHVRTGILEFAFALSPSLPQ